jgi:protein JSN1
LTVLRIVNQKVEPDASKQIVHALFFSQGDHVLTDVLGDQVNGVAVVHKILQSQFLDPAERPSFLEATKRVLIDLKVTSTQAYRRLIEECGLPVPNFPPSASPAGKKGGSHTPNQYGMSPGGFQTPDQALTSMMQSLQMGVGSGSPSLNSLGIPQVTPPQLQINPNYTPNQQPTTTFSPSTDPFNPFALRSPEASPMRNPPFRGANGNHANGSIASSIMAPSPISTHAGSPLSTYPSQSPNINQAGGGMLNMGPPPFGSPGSNVQQQLYQAYMYSMFQQQNTQNSGSYQN